MLQEDNPPKWGVETRGSQILFYLHKKTKPGDKGKDRNKLFKATLQVLCNPSYPNPIRIRWDRQHTREDRLQTSFPLGEEKEALDCFAGIICSFLEK
jgi:hypothetical protein